MDGRYEQPVVVPQVMHPTRRFQDVTSVPNGAICSVCSVLARPCANLWTREHGQNTDTQGHQHLRSSATFWSTRLGSDPCFSHGHVFAMFLDRFDFITL